jgi:hypothetical protein
MLVQCPEIWTSSIEWAPLSRFHLKTETESGLRNVVLNKKHYHVLNKNRMMDNVQKQNICIKYPSSYKKLLIPWSAVLLEKLTVGQLVKIFSAFYRIRRLITAFRVAYGRILSCGT